MTWYDDTRAIIIDIIRIIVIIISYIIAVIILLSVIQDWLNYLKGNDMVGKSLSLGKYKT